MTVRTVVFGNSFASLVQLPGLRWAGGAEVLGLAGAHLDKARATAAEWDIPHATDRWEELLGLDPDLVLVSTPVHLHAPMVRAALDSGAAVLCEKPFTLDAREAEELCALAQGRLAVIDHQLRLSPWRRHMRRLVDEGYVGDLWSARADMHFGSAKRLSSPFSWWYDAARGGGTLGAIASHLIDGLTDLCGPARAVAARLHTYVPARNGVDGAPHPVTADEHATLWLRLESGAQASVDTNIMSPGGTGLLFEVVGSAGTLRLEDEVHLLGARHGEELAPLPVDSAHVPTSEELGTPDLGPFGRMFPLLAREVVQAVESGATAVAGAATFDDALVTMRLLDAARRAAREERWVSLDA